MHAIKRFKQKILEGGGKSFIENKLGFEETEEICREKGHFNGWLSGTDV